MTFLFVIATSKKNNVTFLRVPYVHYLILFEKKEV